MDANELRGAFTGVLRGRATCGPLRRPDPPPPQRPAVHQRRDEPVHPLLPGRGAPPYRAGHHRAEVRADPGQARRHRPHRPDHPPPHLLRDAGQLQLRRLLQGRGHRLGLGAAHRGRWASTATACGPPSTPTTTRPTTSGVTQSAAGRSYPAHGRGQLLGDGRHRPLRAVLGDLLRPGRPRSDRRAARRGGARSATSRSGTWSSPSSTARTTVSLAALPRPEHRHRCRAWSGSSPSCRTCRRSGRPTCCAPIIARAEQLTGRTLRPRPRDRRGPADPGRPCPVHALPDRRRGLPSNDDRGYVLRRLIRRAVRRPAGWASIAR